MIAYEEKFNLSLDLSSPNVIEHIASKVATKIPQNAAPVRFVISKSDSKNCTVELGLLDSGKKDKKEKSFDSIFAFSKRQFTSTKEFNAVMLVPTGIGSEIGGHAGDATPAAQLLAASCDNLITHPNVVNASDINEMTENTLYTEGSVVCRLLMGTVGLQKVRGNRILTIIEGTTDAPMYLDAAVNAVNAARATAGIDCPQIIVVDNCARLYADFSESGRATGRVDNLDKLFSRLQDCRADYDAIAIASPIELNDDKLLSVYFETDDVPVNPWGGAEAIFTHSLSSILNVQTAHSPMMEGDLHEHMDLGYVDSRKAAEAVSFAFLHCIFKGLHRAPRIITDRSLMAREEVITVEDVSCLVIPDGCIGLPTLAALEQGIPVIAVKGNKNIMENDLSMLPWARNQLIYVENYFEAAGVMTAMKKGIALDTLRRPVLSLIGEDGYRDQRDKIARELSKTGNAKSKQAA